MTWREIADLLGGEARKVSRLSKVDNSKTLSIAGKDLLAVQAKTKKAVDAAVSAFVKTKSWPALSEDETAILARRLLFAENLLRGFVMQKMKDGRQFFPTEPGCSETEVLEFLLIDAWQRYGLLA
jgi:hypothetical protein